MTLVAKINALTTPYGYGEARIDSSVDDTVVILTLAGGDTVRLPREPAETPDNVLALVADAAAALLEAAAQTGTSAIVDKAFESTNAVLASLSALPEGPGLAWAKGVTASLRRRVAALDTVAG